MNNEITFFQTAIFLYALGAIVVLLLLGSLKRLSVRLSACFSIVASIFALLSASLTIFTQQSFILDVPIQIPFGLTHLAVDPLAAFFVLLISLLSIPVSVYSIGYLEHEYLDKPVGLLGALYNLFLLSMILVVTAADGFLFLILWECMTLLSFAFVIFDTKSLQSQRAGFKYLFMTHIGSAFLLFLFVILAMYSGSFSFDSFFHIGERIPEGVKFLLFLFVLIGFGTKAGIVPLHIWLPEAHPAAPSHISALMSGVMIKTAVYGILRCSFDFLDPFPFWWGMILLGLATVTAFLGITYASVEDDMKRVLAYHSIENMGIILIPIGLGMAFFSTGHPQLANLALIAGLFHTLNHAVFKSLLFMAAGAVISMTHTRSLEKLGGLIKQMPYTAGFFLIGALAIAAFPPFNGFVSEWLIFQSLILSFQVDSEALRIAAPVCAAILGLIGAMTALTFAKDFSAGFLALPRTNHTEHAHEVSLSMHIGMGILAFLCLVLGVTPLFTLPYLSAISQTLIGSGSKADIMLFNNGILQIGQNGFASVSPIWILVLLVGFLPVAYLLVRALGGKTSTRKEWSWSCGVTPSPEFEYTPAGFSQPLEVVFSKLHTPEDIYHKYIYFPAVRLVVWFSHTINPLQSGNLQLYLGYIFAALIVCLVWARL